MNGRLMKPSHNPESLWKSVQIDSDITGWEVEPLKSLKNKIETQAQYIARRSGTIGGLIIIASRGLWESALFTWSSDFEL